MASFHRRDLLIDVVVVGSRGAMRLSRLLPILFLFFFVRYSPPVARDSCRDEETLSSSSFITPSLDLT